MLRDVLPMHNRPPTAHNQAPDSIVQGRTSTVVQMNITERHANEIQLLNWSLSFTYCVDHEFFHR